MAQTKMPTKQLPVVTSIGTPGLDTNIPSEKAVRTAISNITGSSSTGTSGAGTGFIYPACGRLTLTSVTPVTTSDVTGATTLYYTPYTGDQIALYNGATWDLITFPEISIAIPSGTSQMYDVFIYNNGGTATLELLAWTSDTARATALVLQNGILCKTGALTRRYVGSVRTTTVSGQTEDSIVNRFLWNYYNRVPRLLQKSEATNHTYATVAYRYWNNDTTQHVNYICGVVEELSVYNLYALVNSSNTSYLSRVTVGEDKSNGSSYCLLATFVTQLGPQGMAQKAYPLLGYHYLAMLEYVNNVGNTGVFNQYFFTGEIKG
jgi:hypothetical protein